MEQKLKELLQVIDDHFNKEVWHSDPPLKEIDSKLLDLALKIIYIRKHLDSIKDIDKELEHLKVYIQQEFKVPLLEKEIQVWLKKDEIRHKVVLDVLKQL